MLASNTPEIVAAVMNTPRLSWKFYACVPHYFLSPLTETRLEIYETSKTCDLCVVCVHAMAVKLNALWLQTSWYIGWLYTGECQAEGCRFNSQSNPYFLPSKIYLFPKATYWAIGLLTSQNCYVWEGYMAAA